MAEVHSPAASPVKDNALFGLAIACVLAGVVAFYWFEESPLLVRIAMVIGGLAAGGGLVWASSYGSELVQFAQAARIELRKVVWPTREETIRLTVVVVGISVLIGVILFVSDSIFLSLYTLLVQLVSGS